MGDYKEAACNGVTIQKNITFSVRFRLYVKLKAIPKEQFDYTFPSVTVLTFDGSGGINTLPKAKPALRHYRAVTLDCGVDIRITLKIRS